jgi:organic radical activating enzyme
MVLNTYTNGDWKVSIYSDGTKLRESHATNPITDFPESMDVKINSWCDAGCAYCHENSTTKGTKSPDLTRIVDLYSQLPAGVEIAIGGGHPLAHEQFDEFVKTLSEQGKHCNVTINQFHFEANRARLNRLCELGYLKGVGYSYTNKPLVWDNPNAVTHVIIGITPPTEIEAITKSNSGKVLLLGYKNFRRGSLFLDKHAKTVASNIQDWYIHLEQLLGKYHLSFDNLAISQLEPKRLFDNPADYQLRYMGDDGSHTCYIDAVFGQIAKSSTSVDRYSIDTGDIFELFSLVKGY